MYFYYQTSENVTTLSGRVKTLLNLSQTEQSDLNKPTSNLSEVLCLCAM